MKTSSQKPSRRSMLTWIGTLIGVVIVSLYLYRTEWVEVTISEEPSGEALQNPFFAAQSFLAARDIQVHPLTGLRSLDVLPAPGETLLISSSRSALRKEKQQRLLEWVRSGGHLMLVATALWDDEREQSGDPLLDALGLQLYSTAQDDLEAAHRLIEKVLEVAPPPEPKDSDRSATAEAQKLLCGRENAAADVNFEGQEDIAKATFPSASFIYYEGEDAVGWASNDSGTQLIRLALDEGLLTVVTGVSLWRNYRIGCFDNAHVLWSLVTGNQLHWLYNTEMPGLAKLLWQRLPLPLLALALLLVLWLWMRGSRFGPLEKRFQRPRRQLLEHVAAGARFLWQHQQEKFLIDEMRQEVFRRESLSPSEFASSESTRPRKISTDKIEELARRSGISSSQVEQGLYGEVAHRHEEFKRTARLLQKLLNN